MLGRQDALSDALQRAQSYLDENAAQLTGVDLTAARKRLDEVATNLSSHAFNQDVGSRGAKGETAKQRQLRFKLRREQMEPVALIARRNLRSVPEFAALQMPKAAVLGEANGSPVDAISIHKRDRRRSRVDRAAAIVSALASRGIDRVRRIPDVL